MKLNWLLLIISVALLRLETTLGMIATEEMPVSNYGCSNNGNDCFLNSTMQMFFRCSPLREYFKKAATENLYQNGSVADLLIKHIQALETSTTVVNPRATRSSITNKAHEEKNDTIAAMANSQHDAQELFSYLIDKLKTDFSVEIEIKNFITTLARQACSENSIADEKKINNLIHFFYSTLIEIWDNSNNIDSPETKITTEHKLQELFLNSLNNSAANLLQTQLNNSLYDSDSTNFTKVANLLTTVFMNIPKYISLNNTIKCLGSDKSRALIKELNTIAAKYTKLSEHDFTMGTYAKKKTEVLQALESICSTEKTSLLIYFQNNDEKLNSELLAVIKPWENNKNLSSEMILSFISKVKKTNWQNTFNILQTAVQPLKNNLSNLFATTFVEPTQCSNCKKINDNPPKIELLTAIKINNSQPNSLINLADGLTDYFHSEYLNDYNYFNCFNQGATQTRSLIQTPPLLVIQNAYVYDQMAKNNSFQYPTQINLAHYLKTGVTNQITTYNLIGMIIKSGGQGSGHYWAYARGKDHGNIQDWVYYNDIEKNKAERFLYNESTITNEPQSNSGRLYLLMYQRTNIPDNLTPSPLPITGPTIPAAAPGAPAANPPQPSQLSPTAATNELTEKQQRYFEFAKKIINYGGGMNIHLPEPFYDQLKTGLTHAKTGTDAKEICVNWLNPLNEKNNLRAKIALLSIEQTTNEHWDLPPEKQPNPEALITPQPEPAIKPVTLATQTSAAEITTTTEALEKLAAKLTELRKQLQNLATRLAELKDKVDELLGKTPAGKPATKPAAAPKISTPAANTITPGAQLTTEQSNYLTVANNLLTMMNELTPLQIENLLETLTTKITTKEFFSSDEKGRANDAKNSLIENIDEKNFPETYNLINTTQINEWMLPAQ